MQRRALPDTRVYKLIEPVSSVQKALDAGSARVLAISSEPSTRNLGTKSNLENAAGANRIRGVPLQPPGAEPL